MDTQPNCLQAARTGRASANHLARLVATHTLTEADAARLIKRIRDGFDAVLGPEPTSPAAERNAFTIVRGGRS